MTPLFFKNQLEFRNWLDKNHQTETELWVGFYKKNSGKQNMTWSQSVDEALCYGWIDSVRKSIDIDSYCIRFTPRKPTSVWSTVNIQKVEDLIQNGLMKPAGLELFMLRKEEKIYSYENYKKELAEDLKNKFKENASAWTYFSAQSASYQKTIIHWIMTAKKETTKLARLEKTITESEKQTRLF